MSDNPDIAVLHDRIPQWGGGERFAFAAARALDATLYTGYVDQSVRSEIPDDIDVTPLYQEKYRSSRIGKRLLDWSAGTANPLETLNIGLDMTKANLGEYDVILESAPLSKWYVPEVNQTVVHYPHSPPRWVYDEYRKKLERFSIPGVEFGVKLYTKCWRALDKEANTFVDRFVANSELVRDRIRRFWNEDATVVYPPIEGNWRNEGDDSYFVTWSRLVPNKRLEMILEAFEGLDERLIVAGDGPLRDLVETKEARNDNIEYKGYVDDIEELVAKATAVIYAPKDEDFGLVGAEALAAGKPLVGVNEGFTRYQAEPGVTGVRFEPTVRNLREVIASFDANEYDSDTIQSRANQYTYNVFEDRIRKVVTETHADK